MKKIWKAFAVAASIALLGSAFTSCKSDDDDDSGGSGSVTVTPSSVADYEAPVVTGAYFPASGATDAYADTDLIIAFDDVPTVSDEAVVTITSGGETVDTIKAVDETLVSGNANNSIGSIGVRKQMMRVVDKCLIIKTHNDSSAYGLLNDSTEYTVSVTGIKGKINSADVTSAEWSFTTKAAPTISGTEITAGHNGTEDFYSIQGALNYVRKNGAAETEYTVKISEGCYYERLFYNGAADITLTGSTVTENAENARGAKTRIYWNNFEGMISNQKGSRARSTAFFNGSADVNLRYLTMRNIADHTTDVKSKDAQAETLCADISGNLTAYQCSFASHQDTLYIGAKGNRSWFYDCYIEGDTDYIWGYGDVVLVENCDLRCIRDTYISDQKSYIFAARTYATQAANKGFVLLNSKITIDNGVTAYYGRNSGEDTQATVLNNVFSGSGTLASALWGSSAGTTLDVAGDPAIAYKDYQNYFDSTVVNTSGRIANTYDLGERVAKREYNGRYVILNRGYDSTNKVYKTAEKWDISAYESEFSAEEDTSSTNVYVDPVYTKNIVGGNTVQLTASSDVESLTYTYESSDETLATVSESGLVTTVTGANGTVTITVKGSNGSTDTAQIKIIPEEILATAVTVSLADSTVAKYGLTTATVSFEPADTTDRTYTLTSTDENVLFYDASTQGLATTVTVTPTEEGDSTVRVWVGDGVSGATITAKSNAYETATSGTATVSASDTDAVWLPEAGSYRMKTDIQNGNAGLWDGLVINSAVETGIITTAGKMSLKSAEKMQTRNVVLYIPVEGASTVSISTSAEPKCTYAIGSGTTKAFTVSETDAKTQTYTYNGSATGIVLGSSINSLTFYKSVGESISANEKYLKVNVIRDTSDDYITEIKVTKTGDFTATWDEEEEATGASGTYSLMGVTVTDEVYTSSDGFVVATGLEQPAEDEKGHGLAASDGDTIAITVSGMSKITLLGCQHGSGAPCTVSDGTNTLATYSSTKVASDGGEVSPSSYYLTESAGTVTITFTGAGWIHGVKVESLDSFTSVTSISVTDSDNATSGTITVGNFVTLTATVSPDEATEKSVKWTSDDTAVATVADGVVTGQGAGTTTIKATALDGSGVYGSYTVTVEASTETAYASGEYNFASDYETLVNYTLAGKGFAMSGGKFNDATYGWNMKKDSTLKLLVSGNCTVTFVGSQYSSLSMVATAETGTITPEHQTAVVSKDNETYSFTYSGEATTLTFTASQNADDGTTSGTDVYLPKVTVTYTE